MTETQDVKKGRSTGWIVAGAVALLICLVGLVTLPSALAGGDGATIGGRVVTVVLFGAFGTVALIRGFRR